MQTQSQGVPGVTNGLATIPTSGTITLPESAVIALRIGMRPASEGLPLKDADRLLDSGYHSMENGYARLDDGILYLSALTPMPGVTGDMIDWWFAWHSLDSSYYNTWHPVDHLGAKWRHPVTWSDDWPAIYLSNISEVDEYIGPELHRLAIDFRPPEEYLDTSRFQEAGIATAICARTYLRDSNLAVGHLIHLIRNTDDGVEMRSRFWLADVDASGKAFGLGRILNPLLNTRFVRHRVMKDQFARELLKHCAEEMRRLGDILPELYAKFGGKNA